MFAPRAAAAYYAPMSNLTRLLEAEAVAFLPPTITRKEEALESLVALLGDRDPGLDRAALHESVLRRESECTTCLGEGLAVPHGALPTGSPSRVALGLHREGIAADAPDGAAVHLFFLLATAEDQRSLHVQVLAEIAGGFGGQPERRARLLTAGHADEVLRLLAEALGRS